MRLNKKKYVVITPVKNEEKNIKETICSLLEQDIMPEEWIIVNDNSQDKTVNIIGEYKKENPWIKVLNVKDLVMTEISARIAFLLNLGVSSLETDDYQYIMKLDGDVILDSDFCSNIIHEFLDDPLLGIASGLVEYNGKKEKNIDNSLTRGAAKFYRKKCWEMIGGAYLSRGWDTIDNYAAQYHGWKTRKFDLYFKHCR